MYLLRNIFLIWRTGEQMNLFQGTSEQVSPWKSLIFAVDSCKYKKKYH